MLPILYQLNADTPLKTAVIYILALGVVIYAVWAGWRSASGPLNPKTGEFAAPSQRDRTKRMFVYGAVGLAIALVGLHYVLPARLFLGEKGMGIPLHTYGLLLAAGFVSAVSLAALLAEREWLGEEGQRKREQILDLSFWVLLAGWGGSHLLFMIVNWKDYFANPSKILEAGGLVFYGGLIGAAIAAFVYSRKHQMDFLRLADVTIPTVSLGQCLGRLGCFSAGCCWGDVARHGLPWGVHFPGGLVAKNIFGQVAGTPSLAYDAQATDTRWVVEATGQVVHQAVPGAVRISDWVSQHGHTLLLHPTQLYESIGQFCLLVALLVMRRYRRFHGEIFASWLICYAILRSTVEFFRGDLERGTLHGLLNSMGLTSLAQKIPLEAWYNTSISQFISLCMFALGATIFYHQGRRVLFQPAVAPTSA